MYYNLFNHKSTDRYLVCFKCFACTNATAVNVHVHKSFTHTFYTDYYSVGQDAGSGFAES